MQYNTAKQGTLVGDTGPKEGCGQLCSVQREMQKQKPVRVYADGVFDLFHHGHGSVLNKAKHLFDNVCLVVGVHNDDVVRAMKGPTVMSMQSA